MTEPVASRLSPHFSNGRRAGRHPDQGQVLQACDQKAGKVTCGICFL
jgi:hypothetical protein